MIGRMAAKTHPATPAPVEQSQIRPDPATLLSDMHATGQGLDPKVAKSYLNQVRSDRKRWRRKTAKGKGSRP